MTVSTLESTAQAGSSLDASAPNIVLSALTPADLPAVATLHETVFGPGRFARTAYRIREGAPALSPACCKLEVDGVLKGAVQMTWVTVGANPAKGMLLGPLAVCQNHANLGYGQALIAAALEKAEAHDAAYVILVGDLPYYERAGFERVPPRSINLPGPVDANRLLIRRLSADAPPSGALKAVAAS